MLLSAIDTEDEDCKRMLEIAKKIQRLYIAVPSSESEAASSREDLIELAQQLASYVRNLLE